MNQNQSILFEAFQSIFEKGQNDAQQVARYFSEDYHQWVDGHELDFDGFVAHLKAQRQRIESVKFTFKSVVEQGNKVATIHLVDAMTTDGHSVKGKVVAQFTFREGKITDCEELTYFSEAREQDRDLGSVS